MLYLGALGLRSTGDIVFMLSVCASQEFVSTVFHKPLRRLSPNLRLCSIWIIDELCKILRS